jgi:hypothetical protein
MGQHEDTGQLPVYRRPPEGRSPHRRVRRIDWASWLAVALMIIGAVPWVAWATYEILRLLRG